MSADPPAEPTPTDDTDEPRQWWQDSALPWQHKPGRRDLWCLGLLLFVGIFAWAMIPLRAYLIAANPLLLVGLSGSRSGTVTIGALAAVGRADVLPGLLLGIPSVMKFDLVYFWAGKLWGDGFMHAFASRSKRSARNAAKAQRFAQRFGVPAILISYLPIPIPSGVIYATVAAAGMTWRKFILVNLAAATVLQSLYMYLGYSIGEPAVELVDVYARYSTRVSLGILAVMIVLAIWKGGKKPREAQPEAPAAPGPSSPAEDPGEPGESDKSACS